MEKIRIEKTVPFTLNEFKKAIVDFTHYPLFLEEVEKSEILEDPYKVRFEIQVIKKFSYTLQFYETKEEEPSTRRVILSWKLIDSNIFKKNEGRWVLTEKEGKKELHVLYELDIDIGLMIPKWISNNLTKHNLPKLIASFEKRAKDLLAQYQQKEGNLSL